MFFLENVSLKKSDSPRIPCGQHKFVVFVDGFLNIIESIDNVPLLSLSFKAPIEHFQNN